MSTESPRYTDNWWLRSIRRIRDPRRRYRKAADLQEYYKLLADEAGYIKTVATYHVFLECGSVEETARLINRDTLWVQDVVARNLREEAKE
jgi:uncharacterized protein YmfQ (DUF2313 family)